MPDVLQRALDTRVAPRRILLRHSHDQPPDLDQHAATAEPAAGVRPFPGDELSMAAQNRVGRDDRGDLMEAAAAQPVAVHSQPTAFLIGQADPAVQVRAEDTVFLRPDKRPSPAAGRPTSRPQPSRRVGARRHPRPRESTLPAQPCVRNNFGREVGHYGRRPAGAYDQTPTEAESRAAPVRRPFPDGHWQVDQSGHWHRRRNRRP